MTILKNTIRSLCTGHHNKDIETKYRKWFVRKGDRTTVGNRVLLKVGLIQ